MLLSLLTGPFKPYLYGIVSAAVLAAGMTIWYQGKRIDSLSGEISQCKGDLSHVEDANKTGQRAIDVLIEERARAGATCEKLLASKDRYIHSIRSVDNIPPVSASTGTSIPSAVVVLGTVGLAGVVGPDNLLDALNRMLPDAPGGGGDAVHSGGTATGTGDPGAVPGEVVYCTNEIGSRNLLKSVLTLRAVIDDMRTILVSMQTGTI